MARSWVYLFVFIFSVINASAQGVINSFSDSEIGDSDSFIKGEFDSKLSSASPADVRTGKFFLRQKFEDPFDPSLVTYQLFSGIATDNLVKLQKFEFANTSYNELVSYKFYSNQDDTEEFDIERVYFDGSYVYVEYGENLYYRSGAQMVAAKISNDKPYQLSISSNPLDAKIIINGADRGTTPLSYTTSDTKILLIELSKPGYFPAQIVAKPTGSDLSLSGNLPAAPSINDPSPTILDRVATAKKNGADQSEIDAIRTEITNAKDRLESNYQRIESSSQTEYPAIPAQATFESSAQYAQRQSKSDEAKQAFFTALAQSKTDIIAKLDKAYNELDQVGSPAPVAAVVEPEPPVEEPAEESVQESSEAIMEENQSNEDTNNYEDYGTVEDRFSNNDEYWAWTGYGLVTIGTGALIPAVMNFLDAGKIEGYNTDIDATMQSVLTENGVSSPAELSSGAINQYYGLEQKKALNKSAVDTHKKQAYLWTGLSILCLGGGITILSIDF